MHTDGHQSSIIAQLIEQNADYNDSDLNLNPCEVNGLCPLATGIESCFVAMTSHYIVNRLHN